MTAFLTFTVVAALGIIGGFIAAEICEWLGVYE
jgi:hypothetical protein